MMHELDATTVAPDSDCAGADRSVTAADLFPASQADRSILVDRAHSLAAVAENSTSRVSERFLRFSLRDGKHYGVCFSTVSEVLSSPITEVPCTPAFVAGVVNLRGNLICAVDLGRFLGGEECRGDGRSQIMVLEHEGQRLGLVVQTIESAEPFSKTELSAAPAGGVSNFVYGIWQETVLVLDSGRLMNGIHRAIASEHRLSPTGNIGREYDAGQ